MFFSSSQLERVYVRGSLKSTVDGFEFTLKNNVDDGTLIGIKALTVDGAEVPVSSLMVRTKEGEKRAEEISYKSAIYLRYNGEATVVASGFPLGAGQHTIVVSLNVAEIGKLDIRFQDEAA